MLRLPFEPFEFLTFITHRGLPGTDYREASFMFIYALSSMIVNPLMAKVMGTEHLAANAPNAMSVAWSQVQRRSQ